MASAIVECHCPPAMGLKAQREEVLLLEARTMLMAGTIMSTQQKTGPLRKRVLQGKPDSRVPTGGQLAKVPGNPSWHRARAGTDQDAESKGSAQLLSFKTLT